MALNIIRKITKCNRNFIWNKNSVFRLYSLWEPDYLEVGKSEIPLYSTVSVQIRGYNYPVLESFQSHVHAVAERMDLDVEDSWAYPAKNFHIQRYKLGTTALDTEFKLNIYERNVQISNVSSTIAPMFVRILEASLPEGVSLKVDIHDNEFNKKRYIPDKELIDLKVELETMQKK